MFNKILAWYGWKIRAGRNLRELCPQEPERIPKKITTTTTTIMTIKQ